MPRKGQGKGEQPEDGYSLQKDLATLLRQEKFSGLSQHRRNGKQELLNFMKVINPAPAAALEAMSAKRPCPVLEPPRPEEVKKARWLYSVLFRQVRPLQLPEMDFHPLGKCPKNMTRRLRPAGSLFTAPASS
jgi:hypothetical protein